MSFERYYQRLCKEGHYNEVDVYDIFASGPWNSEDSKKKCYVCDELIVWEHLVDQTNDDSNSHIIKLAKLIPSGQCICKCGHKHTVNHTTYIIPKSNTCKYWELIDVESKIHNDTKVLECDKPIKQWNCNYGYVCKDHECRYDDNKKGH